jgi:hemolysin activation/secretion protein
VPHSSAGYVYDRLELTRITMLPARLSWVEHLVGQIANGNLQYSEQLGAGGPTSVRGYYTDTAIASDGILASQEVRLPAITRSQDQLQFGVFQDWGHVQQPDAIAQRLNHASLSSAGVDGHLTIGRYVDLRLDVGWQLRPAPGSNDRGSFTDIALTVGF